MIATSRLLYLSAEFGHDREVQQVFGGIFGVPADALVSGEIKVEKDSSGYSFHGNSAGGTAFFLPKAHPDQVRVVLKQALPLRDVEFQEEMWPIGEGRAYSGALTYLHKVKNGQDIYFFANSSERHVDTEVILRGKKDLQIWNPHTGEREQAPSKHTGANGSPTTTVRLVLPPYSSLFYIQKEERGIVSLKP